MAAFLAPAEVGAGPPAAGPLFFGQQVCLLMICLSTLRLRFRWALALQSGVFGVGVWAFLTHLAAGPISSDGLLGFLRPIVAILAAVILAALVNERLAVRAFVAGHLLEEERNDERRQREQTEGKLRVLAQAIGGIVHDLGNPLTVVQMGADLLEMQADSGDAAAIRETNDAVRESAQMLNALRLSLMEQTRVLEGKPIPVDLRTEPLRPIVEAGVRFQNPRFASGRTVSLVGEDLDLHADRLKLSTVFMNLIGNALKYSDGEVRVVWRDGGRRPFWWGFWTRGRQGGAFPRRRRAGCSSRSGGWTPMPPSRARGWGWYPPARSWKPRAERSSSRAAGMGDRFAALHHRSGHYPSLLAPDFLTGFVHGLPDTAYG